MQLCTTVPATFTTLYLPILLAFSLSFVQLSLDLQRSSWPQCLSCLTDLGGRQIPERGEEPRERQGGERDGGREREGERERGGGGGGEGEREREEGEGGRERDMRERERERNMRERWGGGGGRECKGYYIKIMKKILERTTKLNCG